MKIRREENPADNYQILPELGRGSFGTVFLCKDKSNGQDLAVKIVSYKKKKEKSAMEMEIEVLASLNHPAIIQVYDAFDYGNKIYCFMELWVFILIFSSRSSFIVVINLLSCSIQGGELFERVIDEDFVLTERACACFMRQICEAMEYIHSKKVIHLDMKVREVATQ